MTLFIAQTQFLGEIGSGLISSWFPCQEIFDRITFLISRKPHKTI